MSPVPASSSTLDLADIGPDTLWVVWSRVADFVLAREPNTDPVSAEWVLASKGEAGWGEVVEEYPGSLVAALPLTTLLKMEHLIQPEVEQSKPGWVRVGLGLGSPQKFYLVERKSGDVCLSGRKAQSGERTLLSGTVNDFRSLLKEGVRIVQAKDWSAISDDVRSFAQTQPVKWFYHQRTPQAAAILQDWAREKQE